MRRWVDVQLTNGEKTIFGELSVNLKARDIVMANGDVCKKALLRNKRRTIHVKVHFSPENIIDKVYIRNKCWNKKKVCISNEEKIRLYLEILKENLGKFPRTLYCIKHDRRGFKHNNCNIMIDTVITELPDKKTTEKSKKRGKK